MGIRTKINDRSSRFNFKEVGTGKTRKIDISFEFAIWPLKNYGNEQILFPGFQNSYQKRKLGNGLEAFKNNVTLKILLPRF